MEKLIAAQKHIAQASSQHPDRVVCMRHRKSTKKLLHTLVCVCVCVDRERDSIAANLLNIIYIIVCIKTYIVYVYFMRAKVASYRRKGKRNHFLTTHAQSECVERLMK